MNSPYFTGAAPNFGPPSGMAALVQQGQAQNSQADLSGFDRMAAVVDKFKKQQDMGKAADYFVKASPETLSQMGIHPEQWKTFGAREKSAALQGFVQAQAQQSVMQQFAEQAQRLKIQRDEQEASQAFAAAMKEASTGTMPIEVPGLANKTFGPIRVPVEQVPTMERFAAAARKNPNAWNAPGARSLIAGLGKEQNPAEAMNAEANMLNARANFQRATRPPSTELPEGLPDVPGWTPAPDGKGGVTWKRIPQLTAQQELTRRGLMSKRDSLATQLAVYDKEIAAGNKKSGADWLPGGVVFADKKRELERQIQEIDAQLADLETGNTPAPSKPATPDQSLWQQFTNSRK